VVLLGHTRDDQAETVLLALARGSGTRTLAGMAARSGRYVRPLLTVSRDCTRASCVELGLTVTDDPHNVDPRFRRSRLRAELMPVLLDVLGEQAVSGLARSADLARDDADLLDELTAAALDAVLSDPPAGYCAAIDVAAYSDLPAALRRRLVRHVALSAGSPGGALASVHLRAVDALARQWHGQGPVSLPAGIQVERRCGTLLVTARAHPEPQ
jgi:tRNA(Ile)-lysidine synthase